LWSRHRLSSAAASVSYNFCKVHRYGSFQQGSEKRRLPMSPPRIFLLGIAILLLSIGQAAAKPSLPTFQPQIEPNSLRLTLVPGSSQMKPDQVNTEGWDKAWTNLVNVVEQTFIPSLPKLSAAEVELVIGNPKAPEDELTLSIMNEKGEELVSITQIVAAADCEHVRFSLPEDGIDVTPGEIYRIRLSGGIVFGWKYIVGGYPKGSATFNDKPLLGKTRSTFLFRTFGSE
jgi:hypothetical protein